MKKKMLSLATVLCFGIGFVNGCNNKDNDFKKLNLDGKDIVLTVGENTKYSADDLFAEMMNSESGVKSVYEKILKAVVENSVETDSNMEASWELMLDAFEEDVANKAASEGMSKKDAKKALLAEEGYSTIEEKKNAYLYEVKLSKLQENYWKEKKEYYYGEYLKNRMPYYVKHILVKTGYSSSRGPYASVIDSDDAQDLYDVYSLLAKGEKFSYVMNHKSEDATDGNGYHMDLTTSFVTEFLHGVFALDSMMKSETAKVTGLSTEVLDYYLNSTAMGVDGDYNFNVIYADDIKTLGEKDDSNYNAINAYTKDGEGKDVSAGALNNSTAYGSNSALYTRTIIFNQTFNNPGISVIALGDDAKEGTYMELTINGVKQKLLTDEKGNLVFIACAKGSSSDLWVHFLTVDVSPFDENIELFYSMDQEATIAKMVEAKKQTLKTANPDITDTDLNAAANAYKTELEKYETYVDIKGGETQKSRNAIIEELETYVKTYAQRGITSGVVAAQEQFMTYDMVKYYMDKGEVTISDTTVKALVETYIENQKQLIDLQALNSISQGWDEYYERVKLANSDEIKNKKIPMECAYGANIGANCKFNYDEEVGFEIDITYKNVVIDNVNYMPVEGSYVTSYKIGDGVIELPKAGTDSSNGMYREGYVFDGWYTTSKPEDGIKITHIDATRSSTNNKVVLYANWVAIDNQ